MRKPSERPPKEEILRIFKKTEALLDGHFLLTSGLHSPQYFQCAKVLQYPEYLSLLAGEIAREYRDAGVGLVISPAIGGIVVGTEVGRQLNARTIFAEREEGRMKLRRGFSIGKEDRVLVVEDVVTTGGSVKEIIQIASDAQATLVGVGSIVDRSNGKTSFGVKFFSALQMEVVTYQPELCPLCKQGIPAVKPGSRK
ncbi:MAG TPA: orotate phosphoribosyltransferase [Bacteroidota bacterium]|nr:orotate phosphoribosyltransferase [Bacteroidota bacterium]